MPGSMYDRLGDMLHDVLESGSLPAEDRTDAPRSTEPHERTAETASFRHKGTAAGGARAAEEPAFQNTQDAEARAYRHDTHASEDRQRQTGPGARTAQGKKRRPSVRALPPQARDALAVLGLTETATRADAKKAYHEKLKYYHPDRHGGNPVLQKVARDKTRRVIEAWETLERLLP